MSRAKKRLSLSFPYFLSCNRRSRTRIGECYFAQSSCLQFIPNLLPSFSPIWSVQVNKVVFKGKASSRSLFAFFFPFKTTNFPNSFLSTSRFRLPSFFLISSPLRVLIYLGQRTSHLNFKSKQVFSF